MDEHNYRNIKQRIMKDRANNLNFPKNLVMVLISGLEYDAISKNTEFNEFLDFLVEKENSARIFEIENEEIETIPNWISLFTGAKTELHGTKGNFYTEENIKLDNIFRRMKESQIDNVVVGSSDLNTFLKRSVADAEFVEFDAKSKFDNLNEFKYSDEIRYQNLMNIIERKQKNYQYNKYQNTTFDERITYDQYYINYFAMVHLSKIL
jgi:hypothetical protein